MFSPDVWWGGFPLPWDELLFVASDLENGDVVFHFSSLAHHGFYGSDVDIVVSKGIF